MSSFFLTPWGDMRQKRGERERERERERDGVSNTFDIVPPYGRPTQQTISSVVERASDSCAVVPRL